MLNIYVQCTKETKNEFVMHSNIYRRWGEISLGTNILYRRVYQA